VKGIDENGSEALLSGLKEAAKNRGRRKLSGPGNVRMIYD